MPQFLAPVGLVGAAANGPATIGTNTTTSAGGLWFGTDTNLYRSAADTLKTDDSLVVGGTASLGTNPATSGALRLATSATLSWRNAANSADVAALWNEGTGTTIINATTGNYVGFRINNTSVMYVQSTGPVIEDGKNLTFATGTGTKIGTSSAEKLAFYGATPIAQPANTANIDDLLVSLGLRASGGNATFANSITSGGTAIVGLGSSYSIQSANGTLTLVAAAANPQIFFNGAGGTCAFFNPSGHLQMTEGHNLQFGTTTGTRIGTATTEKLGFYGATAIVQPANTVAIDDLLVNLGLRASGGIANFTSAVVASPPFATKTADYTMTDTDGTVFVDSTAAARTITLPTAVGRTGREFAVKDWKGTSATNAITLATTSSQTIDGATTKALSVAYASLSVVSDGANWGII